jgi:hypothetical protein
MLFGDETLVRVRALRNRDFVAEEKRRIIYTGPSADVLVAMVWDQAVDLDLEIFNPFQQLVSPTAPGDSVGGSGIMQASDKDGFGPEVYEWRANNRILRGLFQMHVRKRTNTAATVNGNVYVFLRERQIQSRPQIFPFAVAPLDSVLAMPSVTWQ